MTERRSAEQAFQDLLEGKTSAGASPQAEQLAKLAGALRVETTAAPSAQFKARLRSQLLAQASETPEDVFAAALDGMVIDLTDEAKSLVAVASALEPARLPTPDPAFRFQLRARLVAQASAPEAVPARIGERIAALNERMRRSFRTVFASGMAAAVMAGSGAAMAAAGSAVPGDALYGLKRFRESAQLVTVGGAREGSKLLHFAALRLNELEVLTERQETTQSLYTGTLDDMDAATIRGTELLVDAFKAKEITAEQLGRVARFASVQAQDLARLIPLMPAGARPAANDSLSVLERVRSSVSNAVTGCPCPSNPLTPGTGPLPTSPTGSPECSCNTGGPVLGGNDPDATPNDQGGGGNDPAPDPDPEPTPTPTDEPEPIIPDLPGDTEDPITDDLNDLLDDLIDSPVETDVPTPLPLPSGLPTTLPLP